MEESSIFLLFCSLCYILLPLHSQSHPQQHNSDPSSLFLFPPGFLLGTTSSSYQYEGAYLSDGKGLSNWDVFTHSKGRIDDGSNADVAVDHYHLFLEDVDLMKAVGVNTYRFSISWARILPKGRFGDVNLAGINFYNKLIDALLDKGIKPFVTITHYDSPQELENRYGTWLSPQIQEDFSYFADICFQYFGDRVKYWVTFNEPNLQVLFGYRVGTYPPNRCSKLFGNCTVGDSETEPFIAAHNMILSHAAAVSIYRNKYQEKQGGSIGIVLHAVWYEPASDLKADKLAAERAIAFFSDWFLEPIVYGRYPLEMQTILGAKLPKFSSSELEKMKAGLDFIGINQYSSFSVHDCIYNQSLCAPGKGGSKTEGSWRRTPIGKLTGLDWLNEYPQGMGRIITYVKDKYNNIPMIITENGWGEINKTGRTMEESIHDVERVGYMSGYLEELMEAMRKGADVRGYFAWSLLDNFEWLYGYTVRFGLHYVDYTTMKRTPKLSAAWYKEFISNHSRNEGGYLEISRPFLAYA